MGEGSASSCSRPKASRGSEAQKAAQDFPGSHARRGGARSKTRAGRGLGRRLEARREQPGERAAGAGAGSGEGGEGHRTQAARDGAAEASLKRPLHQEHAGTQEAADPRASGGLLTTGDDHPAVGPRALAPGARPDHLETGRPLLGLGSRRGASATFPPPPRFRLPLDGQPGGGRSPAFPPIPPR